jgi:L-malate glycosyltransferase
MRMKQSLINLMRRIIVGFGITLSHFVPVNNKSGIFFFFPFFHTGGGEKVHSDIVHCFKQYTPWVFFTGASVDSNFKAAFAQSARLIDISKFMSIPAPSLLYGFLAGFINRHSNAVVFGCNNQFFYCLLPYLDQSVRRIDLLHAFGGGMEEISLSVVPYLDTRVVVTRKTIEDYKSLYLKRMIDPKYLQRIVLIENKTHIPDHCPLKESTGKFTVLYVGRGTEEKRVHLIGRIATRCKALVIPVEIILVGDVLSAVDINDRQNCQFTGTITNPHRLEELYAKASMLLITSSREGFPVVVMDAMAHGVVPICTDVGGINEHVKNGSTGYLVGETDENEVVTKMTEIIRDLCSNNQHMQQLSKACYKYAVQNFSDTNYCGKYRKVILGADADPSNYFAR